MGKRNKRKAVFGARLTAREIECLKSAASGRSNLEIGSRLFISARTVAFHLDNAYVKMGKHNRITAILAAVKLGYSL